MTTERIEQKRTFIIQVIYWGIWIGILVFLAKYLLPVLFPFIVAFVVACILNRPIQYISKKIKGNRKIIAVLILLLFLACSSIIISSLCTVLFRVIEEMVKLLPIIFHDLIMPWITHAFDQLDHLFVHLDFSLFDLLQENATLILDSIHQTITHFSNGVLSSLANVISGVPSLLMQTIVTIIAMFFITLDYENIVSFLKLQIPDNKKPLLKDAKTYIVHTLPKFALFYGVIMCLTGVELFLGFTFLKISHAGFWAILIAVLDILPVLGTGTILIPWAVIYLITGEFRLGLGLFVLYLTITIIRNIIEPKLIGKQMGLHPVITLASMLVGMKFFGIWRLFGFPIGISFLKMVKEKIFVLITEI